MPVHPRVCGERPERARAASIQRGSSPRVRGTPGVHGLYQIWRRFIPACAGNAINMIVLLSRKKVHPRVCGERNSINTESCSLAGSSPRVRGTRSVPSCSKRVLRFIPACAGNAKIMAYDAAPPPVHPRVCGERDLTSWLILYGYGSSPRVRGTPGQKKPTRARRRFIPACAGNAESVLPI